MTYLHRLLANTVADLNAEGVRFALVGGLAVSVRIEARFTRDLDFFEPIATRSLGAPRRAPR